MELNGDSKLLRIFIGENDKMGINAFLDIAGQLLEKASCGGLITIEKAGVLYYKPGPKKQ